MPTLLITWYRFEVGTPFALFSSRRWMRPVTTLRISACPLLMLPSNRSSNSPQTYTVDGKQHLLVAVGDTLYAFKLY